MWAIQIMVGTWLNFKALMTGIIYLITEQEFTSTKQKLLLQTFEQDHRVEMSRYIIFKAIVPGLFQFKHLAKIWRIFYYFQVLHIIDSVLEPLVPISLRQAEYFVNLDASKLLSKSTLYDLGGHRMRIFHQVNKAGFYMKFLDETFSPLLEYKYSNIILFIHERLPI